MIRLSRLRYLLGAAALIAGASMAEPLPAPDLSPADEPLAVGERGDLSVLTYNVAGLPWPLAKKAPAALHAIGARLARMRAAGRAPSVVVLQEAFSADAKAIGRRAGYPYAVEGPYLRTGAWPGADEARSVLLGEAAGTPAGSGLVILSDLPVIDVRRAAFPDGACAGFDCLAAKGVVLVTLRLPGGGRVMVADTHFNSNRASGAPERAAIAYRRQAEFMAGFIAAHRIEGVPVVIAGDFNEGRRPRRAGALRSALDRLGCSPRGDALRAYMGTGPRALAQAEDARTIVRRARDMQFVLDGGGARLVPVGAGIPFGTEADGSMLSDHIGYTIRYRYMAGTDGPA